MNWHIENKNCSQRLHGVIENGTDVSFTAAGRGASIRCMNSEGLQEDCPTTCPGLCTTLPFSWTTTL